MDLGKEGAGQTRDEYRKGARQEDGWWQDERIHNAKSWYFFSPPKLLKEEAAQPDVQRR